MLDNVELLEHNLFDDSIDSHNMDPLLSQKGRFKKIEMPQMPIIGTCLSKQIAFYANTGILLNNKKIINY